MKREDYDKFMDNVDNPGTVLKQIRSLGLKIGKKSQVNLKKGTWMRYVKDNFKKVKQEEGFKRAGMKKIMKELSRRYKQQKNK